MFADYHTHTSFSPDSDYPMEKTVLDAIAKGLEEICFTDHWDSEFLSEESEGNNFNLQDYFKEIADLKAKYKGQIKIKSGLELGLQKQYIHVFKEIVPGLDLDFSILSIHGIDDKEFFTYEFQNGKTQEEWNLAYYDELLKVVKNFDDYNVLGHVDLIKRYDTLKGYPEIPFSKIKPILTQILTHVINNNKGIELNTSSFRYGLNSLMPSKEILSLFLELGGDIITIGSDSHQGKDLGFKIAECKKELKQIGFTHFCTFEKKQPIYHEL